jgi:hypothetical protein
MLAASRQYENCLNVLCLFTSGEIMIVNNYRCLLVFTVISIFALTCTQKTPSNPYDPSNTRINIIVKSSSGQITTTTLTDTIYSTVQYGININLPSNVDSIQIKTFSMSDSISTFLPTLRDFNQVNYNDTVWKTLTFTDTGTISVIGTAFVRGGSTLSASVMIAVLSRPTNHQPTLVITGRPAILPAQTCTLIVSATDPDAFQTLTYSKLQGPSGSAFDPQSRIFIWTSPDNFIGVDSVIFKVEDNGYPSLSYTKKVYINVIATITNIPPDLVVSGVRNIRTGDTCTLKVKVVTDAAQQSFISMLWGPGGSSLKDSIFTWVPPMGYTGRDSARFMAVTLGSAPLSDSQTVYINVSQTISAPSRPDSLKIVRIKDGKLTLAWHGSLTADNYTVFRADAGQGRPFAAIDTVFDYLFIDSIGASAYAYYVKANNSAGASVPSDTVRNSVVNRPPKWQSDTVNQSNPVNTRQSVTLSDKCSDPDGDSLSFTLLPGKPDKDTVIGAVYSFTPVITDTGIWWPRIIAADPAGLKDTLTLKVTVTAVDMQPPALYFISPSKDTVIGQDSCTLKVVCKDQSGIGSLTGLRDSSAFTLKKSTTADSLWTATVKGFTASRYSTITLIAADSSAAKNKDTAVIRIKYDNDTTKPSISLVVPGTDSASMNSSSYTITLKCTDASGIVSVTGVLGAGNFTGTRDTGSMWKITVTGLVANTFNTIAFTVSDSSLCANKATLTLHIKNDPTIADNIPPTFTKVSGPASDAVVSDSNFSFVYKIEDQNGVDSVYWSLNGVRQALLSAASGTSQYSAVGKCSLPHSNRIVIGAQDKSTNHNRDSVVTTLNYNRPPVAIVPDTVKTDRAQAKAFALSATDPENDTIKQWKVTSGPKNGAVSGTLPSITYTPTGNYVGLDSLFFRVWDATDSSNQAKVTILVAARNVAPSIVTQPVALTKDKGAKAIFGAAINTDVYPAPQYRWIKNNIDTVSTTGAGDTINAVAYTDAGNYKLLVRNVAGEDISNSVTLTVRDITPPTIALAGSVDQTILLNSTWSDLGATATDDRNGDITSSIVKVGTVTTTAVGKYTIRYNVSDAAGNAATEQTRIVRVEGWVNVAELAGVAYFQSVAFSDAVLYIIHDNNLVEQFQGNSFTPVGTALNNSFSLAIGNDGQTPYLCANPEDGSRIFKLVSNVWQKQGDSLNNVFMYMSSVVSGPGNTFYMNGIFDASDYSSVYKSTAGSRWTRLGGAACSYISTWTPNHTTDKRFCVTSGGTPYFAYPVTSSGVYCRKYNGSTAWVGVGPGGDSLVSSYSEPKNVQIVSDNNIPYIGATDALEQSNPAIWKLNGTAWQALPTLYPGGMAGQTSVNQGFSIAFASDHSLYAAHANTGGSTGSIIVRKFNGTTSAWESLPSVGTVNSFSASCDQMEIVARPNECLVLYKPQGVTKLIVMQWKHQL